MDRVMRAFAAQFQPDGNGYIFRRDRVGPGYRVTAQERDAILAEYDRLNTRSWFLAIIPVVMVLIGIGYNRLSPAQPIDLLPYVVLGAPALLVCVTAATAFGSRAKSLSGFEDRNPDLPALTAAERNALVTPRQRLAFVGLLGVIGATIVSQMLFGRHGLFGSSIWASIVPFAGTMLVALVVGSMKQSDKTRR